MIDPATLIALATAPPGDAAPADAESLSLLDFLQAGGIIGYVIILLSLVALALAIVHLIRFRGEALAPPSVVDGLRDVLSRRRVDDAIAFCEHPDNACFLANIMRSGLLRYKRSPFGALELKAALEEAGQEQVARLSRSTDALALVASIAPMLGLLGTVVGINGAFATISSAQGFSRPDQLAGDISLALVTTIMGLVLAIPATSAVTFFRNRIEKLAADIAVTVDELAIYLENPAAGSPQPPPQRPAPAGTTPQQPAPVASGTSRPIGRAARPDTPGA